jgi:hypothetical protein
MDRSSPLQAHITVAAYKGLCCITSRGVLGGCPPEAVVHPQRQHGRQHEALPVTAAVPVLQNLPQLGGRQELAGQQVAVGPRSSLQQQDAVVSNHLTGPAAAVWGGGLAAQLLLAKMLLAHKQRHS